MDRLIEHQTRFSGRSIQQIYHVDFYAADGAKLAECDSGNPYSPNPWIC